MVNSVWVLARARGFVRAIALVFPLAAPAAAANPIWTQQQELTASDGFTYDEFRQINIGKRRYGGDRCSSAGITAREPRTCWCAAAAHGPSSRSLTASDGASYDYFGYSVSVSGDTAVIGAWNKTIDSHQQQGAAYVFVRSGGVWTQQQELIASDGELERWIRLLRIGERRHGSDRDTRQEWLSRSRICVCAQRRGVEPAAGTDRFRWGCATISVIPSR